MLNLCHQAIEGNSFLFKQPLFTSKKRRMSGITNEECEDSPLIERAKGIRRITSEQVGAVLLLARARLICKDVTNS